jgi:hypothetical protein
MRKLYLLLVSTLLTSALWAQSGTVEGALKDTVNKQNLKAATVSVLEAGDSSLVTFGLSTDGGNFLIKNIPYGKYLLQVNFQSFEAKFVPFIVDAQNPQAKLGNVYLLPQANMLDSVVVSQSPVRIKGDTVEYNAGSFKTKPNAVVEDVLKKLPGVQVNKDGTITAQGETVQRVLVDGKRFFGDDPKLATRNLPSEVIDKIQVFDAQSDQSAFTGFDDGTRQKTINITTKKDKRKGFFGKGMVGGGTQDRFESSLSFNRFNGNQQLTFIGQANNVNRQGFSLQDILGVMNSGGGGFGGGARSGGGGGGRGGGALVQNLLSGTNNNGITTIYAGGLNYRDVWSKKTEAYGSYFYNNSRVDRNQTSFTENLIKGDSSIFQTSLTDNVNKNQVHRFNFNIETNFDSMNSLIIRPNVTYQNSRTDNETTTTSIRGQSKLLNSSTARSTSNSEGYNANADITFRHRFKKRGRTFSVNTQFGGNQNDRTGYNFSIVTTNPPLGGSRIDTINQQNINNTLGRNFSSNLSYTEPIAKGILAEISYNYGYTFNNNDRKTFDFGKTSGQFDVVNTNLTNNFENTNISHRGSLGLRMQKQKYNGGISLGVQSATLESYNVTKDSTLSQKFINLFPSANFTYNFSRSKNLRFNYRGRTNQPSVTQLQPVVDNSNPLYIQEGNPGLAQEFNNSFNLNYSQFDVVTFRNFFVALNGSVTADKIVNSTIYTPAGGQIVRPINMGGVFNVAGFVNFGFPVKKLKGNINFGTNVTYAQDVSMVNNIKNYTRNTNTGLTVNFNTTKFENLDINISSTTNYNFVRYTLQPEQNANFFTQIFGLDLTHTSKKGLILGSEFDYTYNGGRTDGFNQSIPLLNLSIGTQIFKNKSGELKLTVYDVLNQNQSIVRTVTDNTVRDVRTNILTRYASLTFTYNLRKFAGANMPMPSFMNNMFRRSQRTGGGIMMGGPGM